nr:MAG TPA: hypothetical protein [Caudoviricetes sp.]
MILYMVSSNDYINMSTSNNFIICITCFIIRFNYYLNSLFIHNF